MSKVKAQNSFEVYAGVNRQEMMEFVPKSAKKILDVGCAVGKFGEALKSEREAEVWGVEIDEQAAAVASTKLDKVFCAGFDRTLNLPRKEFDCIVFNDVLEHMVDPYDALIYAKELLTENGKVIASIPNVRFFDNMWTLLVHKNWEYADWGILDRTHLRFFTNKSIVNTFVQLGYEIESVKGINPLEESAPWQTKKFKLLNLLTLKRIEDMRWMQFAIVASPQKS
ncbi:MAG TPA: class I SAM-dependent methyltransferase [Pyrinomonadaceae bacterium]|nr:class I SAM-dependent methyltransferase [Pyrinomonadaceae bacterium]